MFVVQLNDDEMALVDAGKQLTAMSSLKTRTGCGLKEAKEAVWRYERDGKQEDGHISVELDFVPIEERLPPFGRNVLVYATATSLPCIFVAHLNESGVWFGRFEESRITHWCNLPEMLR